jgi:hypothetical protein
MMQRRGGPVARITGRAVEFDVPAIRVANCDYVTRLSSFRKLRNVWGIKYVSPQGDSHPGGSGVAGAGFEPATFGL